MQEKGDQPLWSQSADAAVDSDEKESETADQVAPEDIQLASFEDDPEEKEQVDEQPRSFADRLPNLKHYRNRLLIRRLALIIGILMVPLLVVLYFVSPLSRLTEVTVKGNQDVSQEEIIVDSDLTINEDLWPQFLGRNKREAAIEKAIPRIKQATISLVGLNHFEISVQEYEEVALLAQDDTYAAILENGVVLSETSDQPIEGLPILEDFTDETQIKAVLTAYQKLSQELQDGISQIKSTPRESNTELLTLFMNDGNQIIVNISNMASQMQYYPQIASDLKEASIVDMEVGIFTYPISSTKEDDAKTEQSEDADS
ncbi:cell division protein FtsQ/DivIB [Enterococcus sp. DIV0876]|uniref:cell division protein FtsQ/DivIB n=1 Tax=Enterococcus sp. DIV0876 TaxID=2774633 RepID=UPI003D30097C